MRIEFILLNIMPEQPLMRSLNHEYLLVSSKILLKRSVEKIDIMKSSLDGQWEASHPACQFMRTSHSSSTFPIWKSSTCTWGFKWSKQLCISKKEKNMLLEPFMSFIIKWIGLLRLHFSISYLLKREHEFCCVILTPPFPSIGAVAGRVCREVLCWGPADTRWLLSCASSLQCQQVILMNFFILSFFYHKRMIFLFSLMQYIENLKELWKYVKKK